MLRTLLSVAALCVAMPAYAQTETRKPVERTDFNKDTPLDNEFLAVAAQNANSQCNFADLVEKRASRQEVKDFAKKLKTEHRALLKEIAESLRGRKIAIVATPTQGEKDRIAEMKKMNASDFETHYLTEVIARHEKAIKMCENQIKNGKDKEVSDAAAATVKKLREHLKEARKLNRGGP